MSRVVAPAMIYGAQRKTSTPLANLSVTFERESPPGSTVPYDRPACRLRERAVEGLVGARCRRGSRDGRCCGSIDGGHGFCVHHKWPEVPNVVLAWKLQ